MPLLLQQQIGFACKILLISNFISNIHQIRILQCPKNCHLVRFITKTTAQGAHSNSTHFYAKLINLPNTTSISGRKNHIIIQRHAVLSDFVTKLFTFTATVQSLTLLYFCNAK